MRTFLGVDQSLRGTGLVVLDAAGGCLLRRLVQPGRLAGVERLAHIREALRDALKAFTPVRAAFEGYSFDSTNRAQALGELAGMVQLVLWDANIPQCQIPPKTLKRFVAGNGSADKAKMLAVTKEKWNQDFGDEDDVCDAYGLARLVREMSLKTTTVRYELEVVHGLLNPVVKTAGAKASRGKIKVSI